MMESKIFKVEKKLYKRKKKDYPTEKVISAEEYKKVTNLRNKVRIQKERNNLLDNIAKQRSKARTELLKI